jgi:hypothetical protein
MKKYLLLGIIAAAAIGGGVFLLNNKPVEENRELSSYKLSDDIAVSPVLSFDGRSIWFANKEGLFFRVTEEGSRTEHSMPFFESSLHKVFWANNSGEIIVSGMINNRKTLYYFDKENRQYIPLAQNIIDFDWMPDGHRIIQIWKSSNESQSLVITDANGLNYFVVADLPWHQFIIRASPSGDKALLISRRVDSRVNNAYLFDLGDGSYETLISGSNVQDAMWLDSERFIYHDQFHEMFLFNAAKKEAVTLNIKSTVNKIFFDSYAQGLYAPVLNGPQQEKVIRYNFINQEITDYFIPAEHVRIKQLFVVGGYLAYLDANDGKLYIVK